MSNPKTELQWLEEIASNISNAPYGRGILPGMVDVVKAIQQQARDEALQKCVPDYSCIKSQ